ncbi:MAG: alpha/beta hydrolase [Verrucomicrobiaceae bacterium]|nr:alpha/beta hydrolase [Verrucomicrobiaceae bacterium]
MSSSILTLSNGLKLGYTEYGDPRGEVAFYFHGWPSSCVQGCLFDGIAKKHGLRLICPDRPGIGLSDPQPGRTLADWPQTLTELATHVGADNWHVIAWSGGGPYVLACALLMPKRLLSATIICGAPPLSFLGDREMFWIYRLLIQMRKFFPSVLGGILKLGAVIARMRPGSLIQRVLLKMLGAEDRRVLQDPEVFRVVCQATLGALDRPAANVIADADIYLSEWGFEVSRITFPIHFWHGKQDRNIAWTYTERLATLLPHATAHWSDIDGHYSMPVTHAEQIITTLMKKPESSPAEEGGLMTRMLRSLDGEAR